MDHLIVKLLKKFKNLIYYDFIDFQMFTNTVNPTFIIYFLNDRLLFPRSRILDAKSKNVSCRKNGIFGTDV